jgi:hypothetical protein
MALDISPEIIVGAFGSLAVFCGGLVWWTLKRSEKIQDTALERWKEQTDALQKVGESIAAVGTSLSRHDELNGIAHKEAANIMKDVAVTLEKMNGKKN